MKAKEIIKIKLKSKRKIKSAMAMKNLLRDERGVSTVIGFVLIMGIVIAASTVYFTTQVPEWTEEFEAEHASKVSQDFAKLSSNIEMAVSSEDPTASAASPIGMMPGSAPLLGIFASGGTLSFNPNNETFECIASAPDESEASGSGFWNNTSNWSYFDKFHVKVTASGATLEPEAEKDIIIEENTTIPNENISSEVYCDNFIVQNNSILTVRGRLKVYATTIIVEAGSKITADGEGWAGGSGNAPGKNGSGPGGGGGGNIADTREEGGAGGGGGGYGGKGGAGGGANAGPGGTKYSSEDMGSGGGGGGDWKNTSGVPILGSGGNGGAGGGLIWLEASKVDISGVISANGSAGEGKERYAGQGGGKFKGGGGGGGSGGCIIIKGDIVNITGMLYAVGGNGGSSDSGGCGGGGGGGIIRVFYGSSIHPDAVNTTHINVSYGSGGSGESPDNAGEDGVKAVSTSPFIPSIFYYSTGYLVSNMTAIQGHIGYDTGHTLICYGNLTYSASIPPGTDMVLKVRTSMNPNMTDAMSWEECPAVSNGQDISGLSSVSDGHRYIQWRAAFLTFNPEKTPALNWINITYEYGIKPVLVSSSGNIEFGSSYLYFPNYKLIHVHGATIKNQTGSEFMLLSPPFSISKEGDVTKLKITAINLTGSESSVSGAFSSTVKASYQNSGLVTGGLNFYNLTISITTNHPTAWRKWFDGTCKEAGLVNVTEPEPGNYTIMGNGTKTNPLRIVFYGNESKPVNLWLKSAEAKIEILK